MVTILIATIIHMNMGYGLPEALGRGVVSALLLGITLGIIYAVIALIITLLERR